MNKKSAITNLNNSLTKPTFYQAVTIWQGEPEWQLNIFFGEFETISEAVDWGRNRLTNLRYDKTFSCLTINDHNNQSYLIDNSQVVVKKLKPESTDKLMVSEKDYLEIQVPIKNFPITPGLDGTFVTLAYGVANHYGQFIPLSH